MKRIIAYLLAFVLLIISFQMITTKGATTETKDYDFIRPIFFRTWEHKDFRAAFGYKSVVYNDSIYQIVRLGQIEDYMVVNDTICISKYSSNTGELLNFNIFTTDEPAGPEAIVEHKNQIFVLCFYLDYRKENTSFVLVYDLDLNLNNIHYILNSENYSYFPIDMISDGEDIYITGAAKKNEKNADRDIFVAKFDSNISLIWIKIWDFNGENQDTSLTGSIIKAYKEYIYVTGSVSRGGGGFLLKISKNGNISNFIIEENVYEEGAIDAADGQIYVAYSYIAANGSNIKLYAYDTDLNRVWHRIIDVAQEDIVDDILVVDGSIYITGTTIEINLQEPLNPFIFNAYIAKYNLKNNCTDWIKLLEGKISSGFSINADRNSLYLSGAIAKIIEYKIYSFILKFSKEKKSISNFISLVERGKNRKIFSFLDKSLVEFKDIKMLVQKMLNIFKSCLLRIAGCRP